MLHIQTVLSVRQVELIAITVAMDGERDRTHEDIFAMRTDGWIGYCHFINVTGQDEDGLCLCGYRKETASQGRL